MQTPEPTPNNWRQTLRIWLIDPFTPTEQLAQQQALTVLALVLFVLCIFIVNLFVLVTPGATSVTLNLMTVVMLFVAYLLSRTRYRQTALGFMLATITIPLYFMVEPGNGGDSLVLLYLVIPFILANAFFPLPVFLFMVVANLIAVLIMPIIYTEVSMQEIISGPFSLLLTASIVLSVVRFIRPQYLAANTDESASRADTRLRNLREFAPLMIAVHKDGVFKAINRQGLELLKLSAEADAIGQRVDRFFSRTDNDISAAHVTRLRHNDEFAMRARDRVFCADGTSHDVEITTSTVLYEGQLATQMIVQDISSQRKLERKVRELQSTYQVVSEMLTQYGYEVVVNEAGEMNVSWMSDGFMALVGYTFEEISTQYKHIHPEDISTLNQHIQQLLKGHPNAVELRLLNKANEVIYIRDYARPIWDEDRQRVIGYAGVGQDISPSVRAEEALRDHVLQQAVVAELGQRALNANEDMQAFISEAIILTAQVLECAYCKVLELDTDGSQLRVMAQVGWNNDEIDDVVWAARQPESQAAYTLITEEPVITLDTLTDKRFGNDNLLNNHKEPVSGISVILRGQRRILGVLEAHAPTKGRFLLDDLNFVQAIGNVLATYIEQHYTRKAEREQRTLAEALHTIATTLNSTLAPDEVLNRILENLTRVLPHDAASIMLVDDGHTARVIGYLDHENRGSIDAAEIINAVFDIETTGVLSQIVSKRQAVIIANTHEYAGWRMIHATRWIRSYIGVPIIFQGQLLGFINVDSATPNRFTPEHAVRLQAFADQASIALNNAQRASQLENQAAARTRELAQAQRNMQSILEATGEGIFYTEGTVIRYANEALHRMTGYAPGVLNGNDYTLLQVKFESPDGEDFQPEFTEALKNGNIWRGEAQLSRKDGTTFPAGLTISLMNDATNALNTVTLVRDISQVKLLDAQKARFIASAAHELRSPVTTLNTRIYLMQRDASRMDYHVDILKRVVTRINRLIEDLLDLSRFENGAIKVNRIDLVLQSLVADVLEIQAAEVERHGLILTQNMVEDPLHTFADPDRIVQVLTILLNNAVNYSPEGGTITVHVYNDTMLLPDQDEIIPCVVVAVQDEGMGIKQEDVENIFLPFYRIARQIEGTGLGLSIAREIVRQHKGDIRVHSVLNVGSTFYVHLPASSL